MAEEDAQYDMECPICYELYDEEHPICSLFSDEDENGRCTHSICKPCADVMGKKEGFRCPACNRNIKGLVPNAQAMLYLEKIKAVNVEELNEEIQKLKQVEQRLQHKYEEQQHEFDMKLRQELEQQMQQLNSDFERRSNEYKRMQKESKKRLEEITRKHNETQLENERELSRMQQEMRQKEEALSQQVEQLRNEKERLRDLTQHTSQQSQQEIEDLRIKIKQMQTDLKQSQQKQLQLKNNCESAESNLRAQRAQLKKYNEQISRYNEMTKAQQNTLNESFLSTAQSFLQSMWTSVNTSLVANISEFDLREKRGKTKRSKVQKAIHKTKNALFALKKVDYRHDAVSGRSGILQVVGDYWQKPSPEQIRQREDAVERNRLATFREAALLHTFRECHQINPFLAFVHAPTKGELYLQLPYVECDLEYLLENVDIDYNSAFTNICDTDNIKKIIHQLLIAVSTIHSANVVHRHISPSAILVDTNAYIQLASFSYAVSEDTIALHPDNVPRMPKVNVQYLAPELLYYSSSAIPSSQWKAIDMWAVGIIFAHLLLKEPLFKSSEPDKLLSEIFQYSECRPNPNVPLESDILRKAVAAIPNWHTYSLSDRIEDAAAVSLLARFLEFDPVDRITVDTALADPYFSGLADESTIILPTDCTDEKVSAFIAEYCTTLL